MKAIRIHNYGGPEVLVYEDAPHPMITDDDVLIKVAAAAVNPVDRSFRAGYMQRMMPFPLPLTLGIDLAGAVEAIGANVISVALGDAVYGLSQMRLGAYSEYAVINASEIAPKPTSLDFVAAASVPLAGTTAWQGLFDVGGLQAGQLVLIHGAGGGVGSLAVQFALAKGARVLATAGSDKIALLRDLGVTEAIDYTTTRFEDVARDVDVVFDTARGGELTERSLAVLKPGGIYVSPAAQLDAEAGKAQGVRATGMMSQANPAQLREIAALIDAGTVKPVVSRVLPLAEAQQAHELLEGGHVRGKIVLRVVEE